MNQGYPPGGGYGPPGGGYGAPPGGGGYGAPPGGGGYGAPPGPYGVAPPAAHGFGPPPPPPMAGYGMNPMAVMNQKNPGLAVALELLGGSCLQTFGIGHLYAGNVGIGLAWMFGYWAICAVNFFLCFIFVGFITWPLCWVAAMIISAITANNAAKAYNAKLMGGGMPY